MTAITTCRDNNSYQYHQPAPEPPENICYTEDYTQTAPVCSEDDFYPSETASYTEYVSPAADKPVIDIYNQDLDFKIGQMIMLGFRGLYAGDDSSIICRIETEKLATKECLCPKPEDMPDEKIKRCINQLLYEPESSQTDSELLSIVILKKKADKFNFLTGFTKFSAVGSWRDIGADGRVIKTYPDERNVQIDVEFKDRPDEAVHKRLLDLFREFNRRHVGEQLLYTRVVPVEESSL